MTARTNTEPAGGGGRQLLAIALEAANAGAAVIRDAAPRVRSIEWRSKNPADFVSEVDLAAEAAVLGVIRRRAPTAAILAEESGATPATDASSTSGIVFVVDPLDGTTNFLHGYPEYACSVGVVVNEVPTAGVVIDVALGETFTASIGGGAFVNGAPIRVSPINDPKLALIGTGFPFTQMDEVEPYLRRLERVIRGVAGVRRAGAAALDLAAVAAGRFEAFWESVLSPWDVAAGMVLVREAGGIVTDLDGQPCPVRRTGVVAGNPSVHAWLVKQINGNGE